MATPQNFMPNYDDFLKWYQNYQISDYIASIAHTANSSVCLSQSSSLGPWVLDSGASDHVIDNKSILSSLSTSSFLDTITFGNGSQTRPEGINCSNCTFSMLLMSFMYLIVHLIYF